MFNSKLKHKLAALLLCRFASLSQVAISKKKYKKVYLLYSSGNFLISSIELPLPPNVVIVGTKSPYLLKKIKEWINDLNNKD